MNNKNMEITTEDLMEDEYHRFITEEDTLGKLDQDNVIKVADLLDGLNESNIEEGRTFNNYKVFCEELNIGYKSGNTKKKQLKELETYYFDYKQNGYKITITNIHNLNKIQKKTRTLRCNYKDYIEELIISIMIDKIKEKEKDAPSWSRKKALHEEIILSQGQLARAIGMVNQHYAMVSSNSGSYCKINGYDKMIYSDWSDSFHGFLKRSIKNAISSLRDKRLIMYEMRVSVCDYNMSDFSKITDADGDEYLGFDTSRRNINLRLATPEEKSAITRIEKQALNKFNVEKVSDLFKSGGLYAFSLYKNEVSDRLIEQLQIQNYFLSYALSFSDDIIENYAKTEDIDFTLTVLAKQQYRKQMNQMVMDKVQGNVQVRKMKAISSNKLGEMLSDKQITRIRDDYESTCQNITDDIVNQGNRVNHKRKILERKSDLDTIREKRNTSKGRY